MATTKIFVEDTGTDFVVTLSGLTDLPDATTKEFIFQLPNMTTIVRPALFVTDGSDNLLHYKTVAHDLSLSGEWRLQAHVVTPLGDWHSTQATFIVCDNLGG